jgi:general secretion pathway protein D
MQDQIIKKQSGVPILSSIPLLGALFSYQDDEYIKSELVIFIKPVVIHDASLTGDLSDYRKYLLDDMDAGNDKLSER